MEDCTEKALLERENMGPRYHVGVRSLLREIFGLYNISGDGHLSPEEWIGAHKTVAQDMGNASSVSEQTFSTADTNRDGRLQRERTT